MLKDLCIVVHGSTNMQYYCMKIKSKEKQVTVDILVDSETAYLTDYTAIQFNKYLLINLSLRMATASAMSLTPVRKVSGALLTLFGGYDKYCYATGLQKMSVACSCTCVHIDSGSLFVYITFNEKNLFTVYLFIYSFQLKSAVRH